MPDTEKPFAFDPEEWRKQFGDRGAGAKADTAPRGDGVDPTAPELKGNGSDAASGIAVLDFPVLAEEAFHGPAGDIVRTIAPHTESDPALLLIGSLVYFGNTLGHGPHHVVEGTPHYPNLYALFVGDTAKARKGTGDGRVRQIFQAAAPDWCNYRIKSGLSSGEGLINEVRDEAIKMVKGEVQIVDEGVEDKRLLIVQSEFGGALQALKREGSLLSTVLRDGWDGRNLATLVKQSPLRATNPHISVIGHISKAELVYLMDQMSMANGLGNRFLFTCVRRSNILPVGGKLAPQEITRLGAETGSAIERACQIGEVRWSVGVPENPGGAEGWKQIYGALSEARPGLLGALTARAEAQVVRLAMTYALWDGSALIEPAHLMAALAVQNYCEASARYVFGDKVGNPIADTILAALRNACPEGLTRTEIHALLARNAQAGVITTALQDLQSLGRATMSRRQINARGGRPTEIWTYRH
jgi:hypothetical protein